MHTPVSIYLKVRDMYPQSALMESSDYHAGENSLSFIALCPLASIGRTPDKNLPCRKGHEPVYQSIPGDRG